MKPNRVSARRRVARLALAGAVLWALWKAYRSGVTVSPVSSARLMPASATSTLIVLVVGSLVVAVIGFGWRPRI